MPCGGILNAHEGPSYGCFVCDTPTNDLWVEEWDSTLCRGCLGALLSGPEGAIILLHRHEIAVRSLLPDVGTPLGIRPLEDPAGLARCCVCDRLADELRWHGHNTNLHLACLPAFLVSAAGVDFLRSGAPLFVPEGHDFDLAGVERAGGSP